MSTTDAEKNKALAPNELRHSIDPGKFGFESTRDVEALVGTIGQERALDAIRTGLSMRSQGFNIFACGIPGTGRRSTLLAMVKQRARDENTPPDWCYVNNFDDPDKPKALELPTGMGAELAADMDQLIDDCKEQIPKAFEDEEHTKQKNETLQDLKKKHNELLAELREKAKKLDHAVVPSPSGLVAAPLIDGETISAEQYEQLDAEKQQQLDEKRRKVEQMMTDVLAQARQLEKEAKEDAKNLDRQVALFAVGHLVDQLMEKYDDLEHVTEFLKDVQEDIIENIETFKGDEQPAVQLLGAKIPVKASTAKYRVNALVAHHNSDGAPVIEERNPTYYNLFGQLEYRPQFGSMTTDFTLIKPGAFHRASGGYLILQVLDVLRNPFAWEGLKRTIRTGKVMIENMWEQYQAVPAAALRPQPIPVKVKVILVGSTTIYHLLCALDEDFKRLFKIRADFDTDMELTDNRLQEYAQFVRSRCDDGNLRPFNPAAVAGLAEHGARLAEHQGRLSTCFLAVADIVSEAAHLAAQDDADTVDAAHVRDAIQARERRSRRLQDHIQRLIDEDTLMIDTEGSVVGQVNGLSVYDLGDYRFGKPSRITCIASVGRAGVVNIERESKLSGSIHDKGVLILSGLMAARFGQNKPLSLTASLCFEQSYGGVDGDSASCAELYALLSALGDLPLRQDIAVTGSVNQRGDVQPIGGVNEKIEGFFEVCRKRGLTGSQGVMIPARNRCNLMLDAAVIEAVDKGQFAVYAVETVEQGIEILSGMPAGKPDEQGTYPEKSVFGRVDRRLRQMADILKEYVAQKENHRNEL